VSGRIPNSGVDLAESAAHAQDVRRQNEGFAGKTAAAAADIYASVQGDDWRRRGLRSSGSEFTIGSIALYHQHDGVHHANDVDVRQP
jgi:hypothetical protein